MSQLREKYEALAGKRASRKTIAQKQAAYYQSRLGELFTRFTPDGARERCDAVGPDQFAQDLLDAARDPRVSNFVTVIDSDTREGLVDPKYNSTLFQYFESGANGHIGEQSESFSTAQLYKGYTTPTSKF